MIEFACPECQKKYKVDDKLAGKKAKCKVCEAIMHIPELDDDDDVIEDVPVEEVAAAPPRRRRKAGSAAERGKTIRGSSDYFDFEISQRPDFALVTVNLDEGQQIYAETSAMASMTPNIKLKSGFKGGLGKTIGRALGGESLIINTFSAEEGPGEVTFAAGSAGDTAHHRLRDSELYLQRGAFMLHSDGVEVTGKWGGAKGFFSGKGLVLLKASGDGDIFFNSYGAIMAIDVTDEYIVDTGYIVAFEDTLDYNVSVLPGLRGGSKLKQLFFGGEGLVCRFSGQGRVWIQTRHVQTFLSWVNGFRPTKNN
ncbi:MAG: TIGR00266 family protein [Planctomycetaceae bacterium]|nr:TIGR00266 family protein [Planctomycetaceae bacterium]